MKGKKLDRFTYEIASFLRYPDSFRVNGIETTLRNIIKVVTVGNGTIRNKVYEWIEVLIESESDYDTSVYGTDIDEAKNTMKSDYDFIFYKSNKNDYSF